VSPPSRSAKRKRNQFAPASWCRCKRHG
jgi:hypothetical protein